MIGSHNTYTYLKSTSWIYNNCKKYWKCQCKTIEEQYAFGVRMFDIRVYRDNGRWKPCHGKANLKGKSWGTLNDIVNEMQTLYPKAIYRIVLEKGNDNEFIKEVEDIKENVYIKSGISLLWRVIIKDRKEWLNGIFNRNKELYSMGYKFALVDTWTKPCYELHGSIGDLDDVFSVDLRKVARAINSQLDLFKDKDKLQQMIESKEELYFLDYATNEY